MNKFLLTIRSYFPTKLPVGLTAFHKWADDIATLTGPIADETSMKFAISSIVIHADAKHGSLPLQYFVRRLRKSAANQVASQVFQDVKLAQAEAAEAAKKAAEPREKAIAAFLEPQAGEDTTESKAVNVSEVS